MNVLSLFDGMSCGQIALNRIGKTPTKYYASEIDKYAIAVTQKNYPDTIQLGSVTEWRDWNIDWSSIDLVGAGFPCQAWSVAGKQLGDKDERGKLFWVMLDIMKNVIAHSPDAKYLIENVRMKQDFEEYITHHTRQALGTVEKHLINSALVSAQNRQRYYWTNIQGITQPDDKGIVLADILDDTATIDEKAQRPCEKRKYSESSLCHHIADATDIRGTQSIKRIYSPSGKSPTLSTCQGGHREPKVICNSELVRPASIVGRRLNERGVREDYNRDVPITQCLQVKHKNGKTGCLTTVDKDNVLSTMPPGRYPDVYNNNEYKYRKLTPLECERLQTVPDNYTDCVSNSQRYKMLGNGWTVDVIAHIYNFLDSNDIQNSK